MEDFVRRKVNDKEYRRIVHWDPESAKHLLSRYLFD